MKKIINIKKANYNTELTIDYRSAYNTAEFTETPLNVIIDNYINPTESYKTIELVHCKSLAGSTLIKLTPHYLAGTSIIINGKEFKTQAPRQRYNYEWIPFDKTKIPKSLAEYKVRQNNEVKTFLEIMQKTTNNYIPNECWKAIDEYSKERIEKCKTYNTTNYELAEDWYKQLIKCKDFKTFCNNTKVWIEAQAEEAFEKSKELLQKGLRPLNDEEIRFLQTYAPAYGVEIQTFDWRYDYRKTKYGYTQEPVRIYTAIPENEYERTIYDGRNAKKNTGEKVPFNILKNYRVRSERNEKLLRDAYFQLRWIMKHLKDEGLVPGYKRCPVCHKIYRENEGCEGHVAPLEQIQADNLFYGIMNEYSDFEAPEDYTTECAQ